MWCVAGTWCQGGIRCYAAVFHYLAVFWRNIRVVFRNIFRNKHLVIIASRFSAEFGSNSFYQSARFEINNCILYFSLGYQNQSRKRWKVNQAGIFSESMRQKKKLVVNRFCERIERWKEAEIDRIRHSQFVYVVKKLLSSRIQVLSAETHHAIRHEFTKTL
jgi:hypothetical protein